jgi:hypothetical protein
MFRYLKSMFRSAFGSLGGKEPDDESVRPQSHAMRRRVALVLALAGSPVPAQELAVDINEKVAKVPVAGVEMVVTVYKPDGDDPFPLAIINHGRAGTPAERARAGRQRYPAAARYFVRRGFAVVVPTRKGYGVTGGRDMESHGSHIIPAYARSFDGALESIVPAMEWAKSLPYVDAFLKEQHHLLLPAWGRNSFAFRPSPQPRSAC